MQHLHLTPPDEQTRWFICETCNDEFEVSGETIYTPDGLDFEADDGATTQCPNDNGDNEHDVSIIGSW